MKTIYKIAIIATCMLATVCVNGQEKDGIPEITAYNHNNIKLTAGGRFMGDAAYYNTEYTKMKSGATIVEARIRASLTYNQWYFYADYDFAKSKVHQKNIFLQYNFEDGHNSLRFGYYNEPSTMALNTSKYNLHFFTRASSALALSAKKALGLTYKYYNDMFFFNQGIFTENDYNNQQAGSQGYSLSGRWLVKPFGTTNDFVCHFGISARYQRINTGIVDNNVLKTNLSYESPIETKVDATTEFLMAEMPWAKNVMNLGVEALFCSENFFVRGEYLFNKVYKHRPDMRLFVNQLGGLWSWTTLKSWQNYYPIKTNKYDGGYIEAGMLLFGDKYSYNNAYGVLNGTNNAGDLELVARYSFTRLNDINDGDFFLIGKKRFYPNGIVADYPPYSSSVGGGNMQTAVLGLNYTLNKHAKIMFAYQYSRLNNVYYPNDKNFHVLQSRIMFVF